MQPVKTRVRGRTSIGPLLQYWRRARNMSQLALAHEAKVSPRHVCFLETGRALPSREMVLHLAQTRTIPLRERNALLLAAGFAPMFRESTLADPELAPIKAAVQAILKQQEPYPAVVMNRNWDIVTANVTASRFFGLLLGDKAGSGAGNVLRLMFHPKGLRPFVENWEAVAHALVQRVYREAVGGALDETGRNLLAEVLSYTGVPSEWHAPDLGAPLLPVLPITFRYDGQTFRFFSAVTVLGTPQDITLPELRIECFFPVDDASAAAARRLADSETKRRNRRRGLRPRVRCIRSPLKNRTTLWPAAPKKVRAPSHRERKQSTDL
ncbi:MAG: helix-turn-helix domain-containing protein [Gemmatimonadaceae bacterium]